MQKNHADEANHRQVLMFCIGAQKAGTTWLQSQLDHLDDTYFAKPKELHYWDCIRAPYLEHYKLKAKKRLHVPVAGDPLRYRMSRLWHPELQQRIDQAERYAEIYQSSTYDHSAYASYVGLGRNGARLIGDITPSYALLGRTTFAEMLACADDVRFVFIMRDPVARLWSGIQQMFRVQLKDGRMTESDLVRLFDEVCQSPINPNFLRSDYPRTISELEAAVPSARIHCCFFETLLDPVKGTQERAQLADFLGIPAQSLNPQEKVHASQAARQLGKSSKATARHAMDGIYAMLEEKFGSRIPSDWGS